MKNDTFHESCKEIFKFIVNNPGVSQVSPDGYFLDYQFNTLLSMESFDALIKSGFINQDNLKYITVDNPFFPGESLECLHQAFLFPTLEGLWIYYLYKRHGDTLWHRILEKEFLRP